MPFPRVLKGHQEKTIIIDDGQIRTVRKGGTIAWRHNNPGNLKGSEWTLSHESIGTIGNYAVYSSYLNGRRSAMTLLVGPTYSSQSVFDALYDYAPPEENDTEAYRAAFQDRVGYNIHKWRFNQLPSQDLEDSMNAIQFLEGFESGQIWRMLKVTGATKRRTNPESEPNPHYVIVDVTVERLGTIPKSAAAAQVIMDKLDLISHGSYVTTRPNQTIDDNLLTIATIVQ